MAHRERSNPASSGLRIEVRESPSLIVVAPEGELDIDTAPGLVEVIEQAARRGAILELDMSGVTSLDSSGMRALTELAGPFGTFGHRLHITNVHGAARRVLELTGLLGSLPIDVQG
jgi:anti-sigma B factor antagonist